MLSDPGLEQLARQLAAMPSSAREFVLDQLGGDEARILAPYLDDLAVRPLSQALRALAAQCAEGQIPDHIRPRAAAAMASAFTSEPRFDEPAVPPRRAAGYSLRARAAEFLARK